MKQGLWQFLRQPVSLAGFYLRWEIYYQVELLKMAEDPEGPKKGVVLLAAVVSAPFAAVEPPLAPASARSQFGSTASPAVAVPDPGAPSVGREQSVEVLLREAVAVVDAGLDLQAPKGADCVEEEGVWNTVGFSCLAAVV